MRHRANSSYNLVTQECRENQPGSKIGQILQRCPWGGWYRLSSDRMGKLSRRIHPQFREEKRPRKGCLRNESHPRPLDSGHSEYTGTPEARVSSFDPLNKILRKGSSRPSSSSRSKSRWTTRTMWTMIYGCCGMEPRIGEIVNNPYQNKLIGNFTGVAFLMPLR